MNTYIQDVKVPIYISLSYEQNFLKFPINPEDLRNQIGSSSTTVDIEGLGQVSEPKTPDLARITIESFFWQKVNAVPSFIYVNWLLKWQKSKKPAKLIVTRLNYSMLVTCENFDYDIRAGEEDDVYFILDLQEYRPHEAKRIKISSNPTLIEKIQTLTDTLGDKTPILVDIPTPSRSSVRKKQFSNPYVCGINETILSITRKLTDSTTEWKKLYSENKNILSDFSSSEISITEGTKLILPQSWINNNVSVKEAV